MKNSIYCAFLRGVNVKGTNMKMAEVCAVFQNAGMENVSSVLASGNIIFHSNQSVDILKNILESAMSQHFNYEAFLFIKNREEIENIATENPFTQNPNFHVYAFVGGHGISRTLMDEFTKSQKANEEDAKIVNDHFYWKVPKGNTLDSTFGKILGRKTLKNSFTSRNINTIEKISTILQKNMS